MSNMTSFLLLPPCSTIVIPFRFLDLPPELRNLIYQCILEFYNTYDKKSNISFPRTLDLDPDETICFCPPILLACWKTCREALQEWFRGDRYYTVYRYVNKIDVGRYKPGVNPLPLASRLSPPLFTMVESLELWISACFSSPLSVLDTHHGFSSLVSYLSNGAPGALRYIRLDIHICHPDGDHANFAKKLHQVLWPFRIARGLTEVRSNVCFNRQSFAGELLGTCAKELSELHDSLNSVMASVEMERFRNNTYPGPDHYYRRLRPTLRDREDERERGYTPENMQLLAIARSYLDGLEQLMTSPMEVEFDPTTSISPGPFQWEKYITGNTDEYAKYLNQLVGPWRRLS